MGRASGGCRALSARFSPDLGSPVSALRRSCECRAKTGGPCHICGGLIDGRWQADHVLAYSGGGGHAADNYLPAHELCSIYRWDYLAEEFQEILKLGVWARTQIERCS